MDEMEEYEPAVGDSQTRIRFENDGVWEQNVLGGSAKDIAASIMDQTAISGTIIKRTVRGFKQVVQDLGSGEVIEVQISFQEGGVLIIKGDDLAVEWRR